MRLFPVLLAASQVFAPIVRAGERAAGPPAPRAWPLGAEGTAAAKPLPRKEWKVSAALAAGSTLGMLQASGDAGASSSRHFELGTVDAVLIGASVGYLVADGVRHGTLGPCRWCDRDGERVTLNGLDRRVGDALRWSDREAAADISDVLLGTSVVVPFAYIAFSGQPHAWADAGLVFESTMISAALTQATKKVLRRTRPYALRGDAPPGADPDGPRSRVSFFSGHTSLAFALAVSSGTIAFERDRGNAGLVLGSGLVLAATTGYLRIAADWHYFIDVIVGAAVGSLSGYLVPKLHEVKEPTAAAIARASRTAPTFSFARPVGESAGLMVNARLGADHRGLSLTLVF